MTQEAVLRLVVWMGPLMAAAALTALRPRSTRLLAAVILGTAWTGWSLLAVNLVALELGWWVFQLRVAKFMGMALEPWLGWVILWGVAAPLVAPNRPLVLTIVGLAWLDLIVMPMLSPLIALGDAWLIGEAVALGLVLVPALLLFRWTLVGTNLAGRVALQVVCVAGLLVWLVFSVAFAGNTGWAAVGDLPPWKLVVLAQVVVLPAILGVRAAIEFAQRGRGTPLPYDPPVRLVTSGPYSYVRNPMQLSMVLVFAIGGIAFGNEHLLIAAGVAFAYALGLAAWHEDVELSRRFGDRWRDYAASVRPWIPRLRPAVGRDATLYVAYSCGTCSSIGRWFFARRPIGLRISPAENSNDPELRRVTYAPVDAAPLRGVAAIARALEHLHLGWAIAGWFLAMPGMVHVAQLIVDAFGPEPGPVAGHPYDAAACGVEPAAGE